MAHASSDDMDIEAAAAAIGLTLAGVDDLTWTREIAGPKDGAAKADSKTAGAGQGSGKGEDNGIVVSYRRADGKAITDVNTITRLNALAIPPAYRDVHVSPDPNSHLQAIGTDEAGRVQYRYHPDWDHVREREKAIRLARLIRALPAIRRRVATDLKTRGTPKEKALAAAVRLIDSAHVRVGNDGYLKSNRTRGATTLLKSHIKAKGKALALRFTGKSGKKIAKRVENSALARALKALARLPGRRAFQYRDDAGHVRRIGASDVNAYLAEIAGAPVTAKDFRTLAASASAVERLAAVEPADTEGRRNRQVSEAVKEVAEDLSNTPAVARKSYVHDAVVEAFESGELADAYAGSRAGNEVSRAERTVAKLVESNPNAVP